MKTCTKCGKEKTLNEFHKQAASNDGLKYWCKTCCSERRKDRKFTVSVRTKICYKCGWLKLARDFYRTSANRDGLHSYCKKCSNASGKPARAAWQKSEKGKASQSRRNKKYFATETGKAARRKGAAKFAQKHPKKARATKVVCQAVLDGKIQHISSRSCAHCGKQAEQHHHPDYDKPLEVIPLCIPCHVEIHHA